MQDDIRFGSGYGEGILRGRSEIHRGQLTTLAGMGPGLLGSQFQIPAAGGDRPLICCCWIAAPRLSSVLTSG